MRAKTGKEARSTQSMNFVAQSLNQYAAIKLHFSSKYDFLRQYFLNDDKVSLLFDKIEFSS